MPETQLARRDHLGAEHNPTEDVLTQYAQMLLLPLNREKIATFTGTWPAGWVAPENISVVALPDGGRNMFFDLAIDWSKMTLG